MEKRGRSNRAVTNEPYPLYDENNVLTPSGEMERQKEAHRMSELPTKGAKNAMRNHQNLFRFCPTRPLPCGTGVSRFHLSLRGGTTALWMCRGYLGGHAMEGCSNMFSTNLLAINCNKLPPLMPPSSARRVNPSRLIHDPLINSSGSS